MRRACGARDPVEGRCPWLVGLIHGTAGENVAFLAASLLAQYKTAVIRTGRHRIEGNFGITWKRAVARIASDSIERRFHILLESEYDHGLEKGIFPTA